MTKYVVAVSGGVDSMVLLHFFIKNQSSDSFVVAHVDHGIREDSALDRELVERVCNQHQVQCYYTELNLGAGASESLAREKRYEFLFHVLKEVGASKIVTAHHADDYYETVIFNILRGTGRKGVDPFRSRPELVRPLLHKSKAEIVEIAQRSGIEWREDSTNKDISYARNRIRAVTIPYIRRSFPDAEREFNELLIKVRDSNKEIDFLLSGLLTGMVQREAESQSLYLLQDDFRALGQHVAQEILLLFVKTSHLEFVPSRDRLASAVYELMSASSGKQIELGSKITVEVKKVGGKRALFIVRQP